MSQLTEKQAVYVLTADVKSGNETAAFQIQDESMNYLIIRMTCQLLVPKWHIQYIQYNKSAKSQAGFVCIGRFHSSKIDLFFGYSCKPGSLVFNLCIIICCNNYRMWTAHVISVAHILTHDRRKKTGGSTKLTVRVRCSRQKGVLFTWETGAKIQK